MNILKYEWGKLFQSKLFLILIGAFLITDLFSVYMIDSNTNDYCESEDYIDNYKLFIDGMNQRANEIRERNVEYDENSFVFRNVKKTCMDYQVLKNVKIRPGNSNGIWRYSQYQLGFIYIVIFIGILLYQMIFYEKDHHLLLLVKGTKHGRIATAYGKLAILVGMSSIFVISQTILELGYYIIRYGLGDLSRSLQSVELYRNCAWKINIGEFLILTLLCRICVAIVIAGVGYGISMWQKSELSTMLFIGSMILLEWILYQTIDKSGTWNHLKCSNIFYYWSLPHTFGEYINVNVLQHAIGRNVEAFLSMICCFGIITSFGSYHYVHSYQVKKEGLIEWIIQKFRKLLNGGIHTTTIPYFEWNKVMIQQKKGLLLILIACFCISQINAINIEDTYSRADMASYHSYLDKLHGKISQKTISQIKEEQNLIEQLSADILKLENSKKKDEQTYVAKMQLMDELNLRQDGFNILEQQFEWLKQRPGKITDKYLIDEYLFREQLEDYQSDLFYLFLQLTTMILLISGMFVTKKEETVKPLIFSTSIGKEKLEQIKSKMLFAINGMLFTGIQSIELCKYMKIDLFSIKKQKLCDIMVLGSDSKWSMGTLLVMILIIRFLLSTLIVYLDIKLAKQLKKEWIADLVGLGIIGIILIFLAYIQYSLPKFLLQFV